MLHEATNVDVLGPTEEASCEDSVDYLIDTDYEGPLSASTEQAIKEKWYNILGPDVEIVVSLNCQYSQHIKPVVLRIFRKFHTVGNSQEYFNVHIPLVFFEDRGKMSW